MRGDVPADSEGELPPGDDDQAEVMVRPAVAGDLPFIFSGWLRSYRVGDLCAGVGNDRYFEAHHKIVALLLQRSTVLVACDAQNPHGVFLGFTCAEMLPGGERLLHYVYVKEDFWGHGVARMLLDALEEREPAERVTCTHRTRRGKGLIRAKGWTYDPYALLATLPAHWDTSVGQPRPLTEP